MDEDIVRFRNILKTLSPLQLAFVDRRIWTKTDKEAAEKLEINPNSVYNWPNKGEVDEAVRLAKMDTVIVAQEKLRRITSKAVDVLDDEMESGRKRRLDAAKEVLDRAGLPAEQMQNVVGEVVLTWPNGEIAKSPYRSK